MRFSIRDLLCLTAVVAVALGTICGLGRFTQYVIVKAERVYWASRIREGWDADPQHSPAATFLKPSEIDALILEHDAEADGTN